MRAARDKGNVVACRREARAEIAAEAPAPMITMRMSVIQRGITQRVKPGEPRV